MAKDRLLKTSSFTGVNVFEQNLGKLYMNIYCQSESGAIYCLNYLYKHRGRMVPNPIWNAKRVEILITGSMAPLIGTPLASVVHMDRQFNPIIHLFFIGKDHFVQEFVWIDGEVKWTKSLAIKTAPDSRLSVTSSSVTSDVTCLRLFCQSPSGKIEEYKGIYSTLSQRAPGDNINSNPITVWEKGQTLDFSHSNSNAIPLPGTDLAFVTDGTKDDMNSYGYWQTTEGTVKQFIYDGTSWKMGDFIIRGAPLHTAMTAAFLNVCGKRTPRLFYVGNLLEDPGADGLVMKAQAEILGDAICSKPVDCNSRIFGIQTDVGFYVFTVDGVGFKPHGFPWGNVEPFMSDSCCIQDSIKVYGLETSWERRL
ncbi:hypothetical protein TWF694_005569 [Orbilia ellipsospora]|uniref:Uncharacterized protein n=1 Tax=Orbilia ellipsospora TaxID=2528407 RepID=A0AAV9WUK4_9PEZI